MLTLGESGVVLDPLDDRGAALDATFRLRVSGAEGNVAIGLVRLGVSATWVSRLGTDALGDLVVGALAMEGVDTSLVLRDSEHPTALTMKLRSAGATSLYYYRRGSAASRMQAGDVADATLDGVSAVHLTGITMALGRGPKALVLSVARRASRRGLPVTFDVNYRPTLWSAGDAADACRVIVPYTTWILCGEEEGRALFGGRDRESIIDHLRKAGARGVVLRIGAEGALVTSHSGVVHVPAVPINRVVDDRGGGDAFDVGFLYGLVRGLPPVVGARLGTLLASRALSGTGEWETLPFLDELPREWLAGR